MRYSIGAVGPRPRSTNWPSCGGASSGSPPSATPSRSSFPPRWKKRSRFLTTSCCPRPRMRWSGATGAIARCKRVSIGCGRKSRSVRVLRWICGVKPKPKAVNKPLHHFIVHGLDKPGSSATVSAYLVEAGAKTLSIKQRVKKYVAPYGSFAIFGPYPLNWRRRSWREKFSRQSGVVLLEEAREPHRCHQSIYLSLPPDKSGSVK